MGTYLKISMKLKLISILIFLSLPTLLFADPPVFKDDFLVIDTSVGSNWRLVFPQVAMGGNNVLIQVNLYDTLISPWEKFHVKGFNRVDLEGKQLQSYEIFTPFTEGQLLVIGTALSIPHSNENGFTLIPVKGNNNNAQYVFIVDSSGQIVISQKCLNCDDPNINNHTNEIGYGEINNNSKVGLVWEATSSEQNLAYDDSIFVRIYDFETDSVGPLINVLTLSLPEIDEPGYIGHYRIYTAPKTAIADNGSFAVTFVAEGDYFRHVLYVVYNADFTPRSEVLFADCTTNLWSDTANSTGWEANYIDVAMESDGDFYIAWSLYQNTPYADVRNHVWVRGFNADGSPKYDPVRVNDSDSLWFLLGDEMRPNVTCDDFGNVLVSWDDARDYPGNYQPKNRNVYVQKVDPSGNLVGFNSRVNNVDGSHRSYWHSLSLNNSGQAMISWENNIPNVPPVAAQLMPYDMIGTFVQGDLNYDRSADITDLIDLVEYMFGGAINSFWPRSLTDVNASGATDISDLVYMVSYMFIGGPAPITPDEGIRPNPGKFNLGG